MKKNLTKNSDFSIVISRQATNHRVLRLRGGSYTTMDEISIAIIKHLRDGRKSYKKIADELGVSENTVRSRVSKLEDEGFLEISGLVEPEAIPGHKVVIVGIKLKTMELVKKGEEFSKLKGVVSVSVVTGRYDLMLVVFLNEGFGLLEFYTEEVARLEDVQSVETFVVYKGYNMKIPYIL
jgi:Lrp/AsnC family transcriptional regulator for asnA, asnC and gidA